MKKVLLIASLSMCLAGGVFAQAKPVKDAAVGDAKACQAALTKLASDDMMSLAASAKNQNKITQEEMQKYSTLQGNVVTYVASSQSNYGQCATTTTAVKDAIAVLKKKLAQ